MTYIIATVLSSRHHKRWPLYRTGFWVLGTICAAIAVVGPLAKRAHIDFIVHMLGHLLLGMLAPAAYRYSYRYRAIVLIIV